MNDGSDIAWLGLERHGEGRWSFELTPPLTRPDGKLYGGTGIAAATAVMEAETGRGALWTTAQFAGSADIGERIECDVEVLARGRRTSQVRVTARVGERIVVAAIGATGDAPSQGSDAQFGTMPEVPSPAEAGAWSPNLPIPIPQDRQSWLAITELREAPRADDGHALWTRMRTVAPTRATLSFVADMVPTAVVRAAGKVGGGTSLDNAVRFGLAPRTEWVLLDFDPYFVASGYVHGAARLWSEDGVLLGVASQTASLRLFA